MNFHSSIGRRRGSADVTRTPCANTLFLSCESTRRRTPGLERSLLRYSVIDFCRFSSTCSCRACIAAPISAGHKRQVRDLSGRIESLLITEILLSRFSRRYCALNVHSDHSERDPETKSRQLEEYVSLAALEESPLE